MTRTVTGNVSGNADGVDDRDGESDADDGATGADTDADADADAHANVGSGSGTGAGSGQGEPTESETGADGRPRLADRRGVETRVYQPAEDSALLAKAALERASGHTLEVGTGSGWVAERVVDAGVADAVVAADLNPHACRAARERAAERFEVVRADLVAPFRAATFDTVLFNPPYLPTDPDHEWDDWMETALSGGSSGRRLIDPFLATVGRVLTADGVVLLLVSSLTGYEAVLESAREAGFTTERVREESYPFETLTVVALTPTPP
jgi:release factor glutamine methyltransferase